MQMNNMLFSYQQDNVAVKVHGSCNVHSLLLPTTQVNATPTNLCHVAI